MSSSCGITSAGSFQAAPHSVRHGLHLQADDDLHTVLPEFDDALRAGAFQELLIHEPRILQLHAQPGGTVVRRKDILPASEALQKRSDVDAFDDLRLFCRSSGCSGIRRRLSCRSARIHFRDLIFRFF